MENSAHSPYAKLRRVPGSAMRWTTGFWAGWFAVCHDVMIPGMWRLLDDAKVSHAFANFRIAAGLQEGKHRGPKWHDGDLYKWLEAACLVYGVTRDSQLDALLDEVIAVIARAQRGDGYIHTPAIIESRSEGGHGLPFQERLHFETYNMGHLMTAACAHHEATGKSSLLDVAIKATDYFYRFYRQAAPELARNAICPSHYMGTIDMYRTTGVARYLELARNLIEIRDLATGGGDDNQDRLPFRQQTRAAGHAVRANYLYAGVADVCAETGDTSLYRTLETMWENVTAFKMYVNGGCGALYDGASPDGAIDQSQIGRVHQAYGREYQLPNVTAHCETCANVGNVLWNWRMLALTGEARFADVLELTLYNSVLSGVSLDGTRYFYTNPLRRVDELPFELRWSRTRESYISCFCCPPNVVRTIAGAHRFAYSVCDAGIVAHLYGGSAADLALPDGTPVHLAQETDYPWEGKISIAVDAPAGTAFDLLLRVPGWAREAALAVNGRPVDLPPHAGTYARVSRTWSPGDVVELELNMRAELIEAHPLVEELRNQVAVRRGPIVYCLESVDLPPGVCLADVSIPLGIRLEPAVDPDLDAMFPGLRVLRGTAHFTDPSPEWEGRLYRAVQPRAAREIDLQLVPYLAWDNRGWGEMTVWIPTTPWRRPTR
jgi:DUF1680 family protein